MVRRAALPGDIQITRRLAEYYAPKRRAIKTDHLSRMRMTYPDDPSSPEDET
jgi:hypothetical protein